MPSWASKLFRGRGRSNTTPEHQPPVVGYNALPHSSLDVRTNTQYSYDTSGYGTSVNFDELPRTSYEEARDRRAYFTERPRTREIVLDRPIVEISPEDAERARREALRRKPTFDPMDLFFKSQPDYRRQRRYGVPQYPEWVLADLREDEPGPSSPSVYSHQTDRRAYDEGSGGSHLQRETSHVGSSSVDNSRLNKSSSVRSWATFREPSPPPSPPPPVHRVPIRHGPRVPPKTHYKQKEAHNQAARMGRGAIPANWVRSTRGMTTTRSKLTNVQDSKNQ